MRYSWTPLCWTRLTRTPRYLEQNRISLGFALSVIYYGLSRTQLSQTPHYLELFLAPLGSNQPRLSRTLLRSKKHWSTLVRKCSQGTSWQDVLKAENRIDVFTVTKAKSDWLDLLLQKQKATSCWYLLILGSNYYSKNLTPTSLSRTPTISNYFSIPLRVRDSGVLYMDS